MALSANKRLVKGAIRSLVATAKGLTNAQVAIVEARTEREKREAELALENRKVDVMEAQIYANTVLSQMKDATERYKSDRTLEGTRTTAEATKYGHDRRLEGTKETADASRHTADQRLKGTEYTADKTLEGTQIKADADVEVADVGAQADRDVADTNKERDENVANIQGETQRDVATTNKEADENVANINKDAKQYDADNPPGAVELERQVEALRETLGDMVERGEMTQQEADRIISSVQSGLLIEGAPVVPKKSGSSSSNSNDRFNTAIDNIPENSAQMVRIKNLIPKLNPSPGSGFTPTYQADRVARILNSDRPNKMSEARAYLRKVAVKSFATKEKNTYNDAIAMEDELQVVLDLLNSDTLREKLKRWKGRVGRGVWDRLMRSPDEEIAELAQAMDVVMQKYRQAISGAAFGEQESKEYQRLFASVHDPRELAKVKTAGMLNVARRIQRRMFEIAAGDEADGNYLYYKPRPLSPAEEDRAVAAIQSEFAEGAFAGGQTITATEGALAEIIDDLRDPYGGEPIMVRNSADIPAGLENKVEVGSAEIYLDDVYVIPARQIDRIIARVTGVTGE